MHAVRTLLCYLSACPGEYAPHAPGTGLIGSPPHRNADHYEAPCTCSPPHPKGPPQICTKNPLLSVPGSSYQVAPQGHLFLSVAPDTRPADTGRREIVSIHPPPFSSSSPVPRALHPKARCLDWYARLSTMERRWAPSLRCGMGWGWGAHTCQLHLGPEPTMAFGCVFPGARRSITRGQPCLPPGCCCLFGLARWSVGSWSPDRETTHNPASQVPSEVERPRPGLT